MGSRAADDEGAWELTIVIEGGTLLTPPWRVRLPRGRRLVLGRRGPAPVAVPDDTDGETRLALRDRWLSRQHARIAAGATCTLEDLGSKNGTLVDGQRAGTTELAEPTVLTLGQSLVIVAPEGDATAARWATELRTIAVTDPTDEPAPGRGVAFGVQSAESLAALLRLGAQRRDAADAGAAVDIAAVYEACGGNVSETARRLGKDRKQVQRWLARQRAAMNEAQPQAQPTTARSTSANNRASSQRDQAGGSVPAKRHSAAR